MKMLDTQDVEIQIANIDLPKFRPIFSNHKIEMRYKEDGCYGWAHIDDQPNIQCWVEVFNTNDHIEDAHILAITSDHRHLIKYTVTYDGRHRFAYLWLRYDQSVAA